MSPAHHYSDFRFKTYAPMAFRFFRELFNIRPDDFMVRIFRHFSCSLYGIQKQNIAVEIKYYYLPCIWFYHSP